MSAARNNLTDKQQAYLTEMEDLLSKKISEESEKNGNQLTYVHHGGVIATPRELDEVYDRIYIGSESIARDKTRLVQQGFTHVINCAKGKRFGQVDTDGEYYKDTDINFLGIPGHDSVKYDITPYFQQAADFMKTCSSGKILVHCHQGISRSAAVTIGCLMLNQNLSAIEALSTILEHRLVMPNKGFLRKLAKFQDELEKPNL